MSAFVQARPKYPTDCFPPPAQRPDPRCAVLTGTSQDIHCAVYGTATHPMDPSHPRWRNPAMRSLVIQALREGYEAAERRAALSDAPIDAVYPTNWGRNAKGATRKFEERMAGGWGDTPGGPILARVHGGLGDVSPTSSPRPCEEGDLSRGVVLGALLGAAVGWWLGSQPKEDRYRIGRR